MEKIEKLTEEQIARFPEFVQKWLDIGLSTAPADRKLAEQGIRAAYRAAKLDPPQFIIWLQSPYQLYFGKPAFEAMASSAGEKVGAQVGAQVRAQVREQVGAQVWKQVRAQVDVQVWAQVGAQVWAQVRDQVEAQIWDQVWGQVRDQIGGQVWAQVRDRVRAQVWAQVRDQVGVQVRGQVRDQVWAQVRDQIGGQVWAQVRDQIRDQAWNQVGAQVWAEIYGQHESWLSFYDFMGSIGVDVSPLSGFMDIAKSAGWWIPYKNVAFVSERHNQVCRDERNRLHSLTGPALSYPDGWSVYAVHGVRVPADLIEHPETITVERIDSERNAEIARVMVELYGRERFLVDGKAERIHADEYGILWRRKMPNADPLLMVEVENSTPEPDGTFRHYFLKVHPELRPILDDDGNTGQPQALTARNAVASTFGLTGEEYAPALQS